MYIHENKYQLNMKNALEHVQLIEMEGTWPTESW